MKTYTRNTILYSVLTIATVASYWAVRQDTQQFELALESKTYETTSMNADSTRLSEMSNLKNAVVMQQSTR